MQNSEKPRLPVLATVKACFAITLSRAHVFFAYAWPWLLALIVAEAALYWIAFPAELRGRNSPAAMSAEDFWIAMMPGKPGLIVGIGLAVAWHRFLLLDERPDNASAAPLRARMFKYFCCSVLSIVPLGIAFTIGLLVFELISLATPDILPASPSALPMMALLIVVPSALMAFIPFSRLALVLPAVAVEDTDSLAKVIGRARGNGFLLALGLWLAALPSYAATILLQAASGVTETQSRHLHTIVSVADELNYMVAGMAIVTFLSLAYRFFADAHGRVTAGVSAPAE